MNEVRATRQPSTALLRNLLASLSDRMRAVYRMYTLLDGMSINLYAEAGVRESCSCGLLLGVEVYMKYHLLC